MASFSSDVIGRLRVLEADKRFLEHTINVVSKREEGLELLREIADHLQQLRKIGIREIDQHDISGCILLGRSVKTSDFTLNSQAEGKMLNSQDYDNISTHVPDFG